MDSYSWTCQCWSTNNNLLTPPLCGHWMQPRRPAQMDDRDEWREKEREREIERERESERANERERGEVGERVPWLGNQSTKRKF